jgi:hypothetical protein
MPVRVVERNEEGVLCRLGSEPKQDAKVEFVPLDCILNFVAQEGSDLGMMVIDPEKAPEGIRASLGMD